MDSSAFYNNLIPTPAEDGDISYLEYEVLVHQVMLDSLDTQHSNDRSELSRIQRELALLQKRLENKKRFVAEQESQVNSTHPEMENSQRQRVKSEMGFQGFGVDTMQNQRPQHDFQRPQARAGAQETALRGAVPTMPGFGLASDTSLIETHGNNSHARSGASHNGYAPPYSPMNVTTPSGAIPPSSATSRKRARPPSWVHDGEDEEITPYPWQQSQHIQHYGAPANHTQAHLQPGQQPVSTPPSSGAMPWNDLMMTAPNLQNLTAEQRHQLELHRRTQLGADQQVMNQMMADTQNQASKLSPTAPGTQRSPSDGLKRSFGSTPNLIQTTLQRDGSFGTPQAQSRSIKRHHADDLLPLSLQQSRSHLDPHGPYSARSSQPNTPMPAPGPFKPPAERSRSNSLSQASLYGGQQFNQLPSSASSTMGYGQMPGAFPVEFVHSSLHSPMSSARGNNSTMTFGQASVDSSQTAGQSQTPSNGLRIDTRTSQSNTASSNPQSAITVSDGLGDTIDLTETDWNEINQMNVRPHNGQPVYGSHDRQNSMHGHQSITRPSQISPASSSSESLEEISAEQFRPSSRTVEMATRPRPAGQGMLSSYAQQYNQMMMAGMNQQQANPGMFSFGSQPSTPYGMAPGPQNGMFPNQMSGPTYGSVSSGPFQQQGQAPGFVNRTRTFMDYVSGMGNAVTQQVGRVLDTARTGLGSRDDPVEVDESYQPARYMPAPVQDRSVQETRAFLDNINPEGTIPKEERMDTPAAMNTQLMEHQRVGLSWLMKQEKGVNKGGILGDDMGLGKTIQAIALILSNPSDDPKNKTTLVVAPVALLEQWKTEIAEKIKPDHALRVHKYHAHGSKKSYDQLQEYDVVLTTYGTLSQEFKRYYDFQKLQKLDPTVMPNEKQVFTMMGPERKWYRAILDESQNIKNKSSLMAKGAFSLSATYRWCVTGTPMMNNVAELWPSIHFCRIKPWDDQVVFRDQIVRMINPDANNRYGGSSGREHAQRGMRKLQRLIGAIMLRRTKKSRLDGRPILQLPERIVYTDQIQFDEEELKFYTELERTAQVTFRRLLSGGTLGKQYTHALVLLLRLRQACCHRHLVLFHENLNNQSWLHESEEKLLAIAKELPDEAVERIKADMGIFQCPICLDSTPNPAILLPCGHMSCSECFTQLCDNTARLNESEATVKCPFCRGDVNPKQVTDFFSFKKVHQPELLTKEEMADEDMSSDEDVEKDEPESDDDDDGDSLKDFVVDDDYVSQDEDDEDVKHDPSLSLDDKIKRYNEKKIERRKKHMEKQKAKTAAKGKAKANKEKSKEKTGKEKEKPKGPGRARIANINDPHERLAVLKKESLRNKSAKKHYFKQLDKEYVPSAKLKRAIELIHKFMVEKPQEKILVFSQFTTLLDLMEIPLRRAEIKYVRYDGSMTAAERTKATEHFRQEDDIKVMILSLKAGNAGLNLNIASQVIILDPFWNPYIEEQAIDRAHRIGQRFDVQVHRVVVPNTVEDRILKLQAEKREVIGQALNQEQINTVSGLGGRELRYLFGV
jgi:SNF2 family DNA or RNA helicase